MKYGVALVLALVLNASANLLMKAGMKQIGEAGGILKDGAAAAIRAVFAHPALIIGLTCFALNAAFYMYALQSRRLQISIAYPVMVGGGYVLIAIAAHLLLAERLNGGQMVGVALVMTGVCLIALLTPATS